MTPDQLKSAIATLGLSAEGFARATDSGSRTVHHWLKGERAIPGPIVTLVTMLLDGRADRQWFADRARTDAEKLREAMAGRGRLKADLRPRRRPLPR